MPAPLSCFWISYCFNASVGLILLVGKRNRSLLFKLLMILQKNENQLILLYGALQFVYWIKCYFVQWSLWHFLIKIDNTFRHLCHLYNTFHPETWIAYWTTWHNITENDIISVEKLVNQIENYNENWLLKMKCGFRALKFRKSDQNDFG